MAMDKKPSAVAQKKAEAKALKEKQDFYAHPHTCVVSGKPLQSGATYITLAPHYVIAVNPGYALTDAIRTEHEAIVADLLAPAKVVKKGGDA